MVKRSRAGIQSEINTRLPDNTTGDIDPADTRESMIDITDSAVFPEDTEVVIEIATLDDFPPPSSGIITLQSGVVYRINANINLGPNSLLIPTTGANISAPNGAQNIVSLSSSENNYTMFVSEGGSYSGTILIKGVSISVTGTSSKVFDLDADGNLVGVIVSDSYFNNCTSLGEIDSYTQISMEDILFNAPQDGLTVSGTMAFGISLTNSITVGFPASVTLFKEGTALLIGTQLRTDMNFENVNALSVFCDFQASNFVKTPGINLINFRTNASDPLPNVTRDDVAANYKNCIGIENTYPGGVYTVSTGATTTIPAANTLVKMAGVTTYLDMQWFSNTVDNAFVYDSDQVIEVNVGGSLSFTGGNGDEMGLQVRQWDDSAALYVDVGGRFTQTFPGNGVLEDVSFAARATLEKNDRIEIWIENQSDATNISVQVGGAVSVEER